jgi:hypothetical protein
MNHAALTSVVGSRGFTSRSIAVAFAFAIVIFQVSPAEAACTVPNQITNGQVADASAVMADFNALGSCATSTSGSPPGGSLAVFSSGTSVTNGDLTGDVTTSGTTTTTLAPTGVTPGTYANVTLTVDAKGRVTSAATGNAGITSKPWYWNPPLAASFTYAGYDSNSPTLSDDPNNGLEMTWPVPVTGDHQRVLYRTLTTPSGDFDWKFHAIWMNPTTNYATWLFGLRDSATGKELFAVAYNGGLATNEIRTLTGFTGAGTTVGSGYNIPTLLPSQIRWVKSGTNVTFYESIDGTNWVQLYTTTTTGLGWTPDQVFVGVSYNRGGGIPITGLIDRFDLTGNGV